MLLSQWRKKERKMEKLKIVPMDPSYREILNKILDQNKMIIEQNIKIVDALINPMLTFVEDD